MEVLDADSDLALLGTCPSLNDATGQEIDNRIAAGWRMLWSMKPLLLNQNVSIHRRLRLLRDVVLRIMDPKARRATEAGGGEKINAPQNRGQPPRPE